MAHWLVVSSRSLIPAVHLFADIIHVFTAQFSAFVLEYLGAWM